MRLTSVEGPPQQPPEEQLEKILEEKEKTQPLKPVSVEVAPEAGHEMAAEAKRVFLERIRAARPTVVEKKEEGAPFYQRLLDAERAKPVGQQNREMMAKWQGYIRDYGPKSALDEVPVPKPRAAETPKKSVEEQQVRVRTTRPLDPDDAAREKLVPADNARPLETKPTPVQKPAPVEVARPQREQITFGSLLRDQVEHVMRRVPGRAWLDTLGPRMQALYHRQFAVIRAAQQEKAQSKLTLAKDKAAYYADAVEHSSGVLKLGFANRLRKWQGREETLRAKVNMLDAYRTRRTERHTALQQRIAERYERETVPYQERIADLKKKKEAILDAKKKLEQKRADAIKLVTAAKAKPPGFFDFTGRASLARLERMVTNADRDIARADKQIDTINAPLAKAEAKFQKFDARRKIAVSMMKL